MQKPSILVVDDELFFRRLYTELLREDGYQVESAATGDEALARLHRGGVDIVLTDMIMPGLDGLEVLRLARGLDNPPDVILATGHASVESAIQALKNGARDYLVKPFNPEELRHLVRTCLEQRRLLDENALLKSQIRLYQRGQNLASILEVDRLLAQAVDMLVYETGRGRGFAFFAQEDQVTQVLGLNLVEQAEAATLASSLLPHLQGLSGIRLLRGEELAPRDDWPPEVQTLCLFPLHFQKKLKGALVLFNPPQGEFPHPFPHENLLFLAEQANLGFENAYRYQGAQELIYTDDLTGLYNYRYLQMVLDQEIRRTERYGLEFSLVFIDLDYFKTVNDTYGHLVGSKSLREVATLLRKSVRDVDILFRYGGDEFTALLVETDFHGAQVVAERIRQTIAEHTFFPSSANEFRLTATVGFAAFPENAADKDQIIELADRAMYEGKKDRNVTRGAGKLELR